MQRHEPCLPKLGAADGQHRGLEIDIVQLEVARVAEAQPRDAQESKQTGVDPRPQRPALIVVGHGAGSADQTTNLLIRISDAALQLGLAQYKVRQLIEDDAIPAWRMDENNRTCVSATWVEDYVDSILARAFSAS